MGKYHCIIFSDMNPGEIHDVETTSAIKAAYRLGKHESGETVLIVRKKTAQIISRAQWESEMDNYYNVGVPKHKAFYFDFDEMEVSKRQLY